MLKKRFEHIFLVFFLVLFLSIAMLSFKSNKESYANFITFKDSCDENQIAIVYFDKAITIVYVELLKEILRHNFSVIIIVLNTSGGRMKATLEIIKLIENSKIPIIGYVYPKKAVALSAGAYILLSTHVASMAPGTIIGACHPVYFSEKYEYIVNEDLINEIKFTLFAKAQDFNRNITLINYFIEQDLIITADEALKSNVIEILAPTLNDLLNEINGLKVKVREKHITITTIGKRLVFYEPSIKVKILMFLTDSLTISLSFIFGIITFYLSKKRNILKILSILWFLLGIVGLGVAYPNFFVPYVLFITIMLTLIFLSKRAIRQ